MKCFRDLSRSRGLRACGIAVFVTLAGWVASARGALPEWIRNVEGGTAIEAALFRAMSLPGGAVLFRRPPAETRPALGELIKAQPQNADLYSLRALEDEQQLDFSAAESDWKKHAESIWTGPAANLPWPIFITAGFARWTKLRRWQWSPPPLLTPRRA